MRLIDPVVGELTHEASTTRRLLERVPQDRFGWAPHEKSMTVGRLATHIAEIPGWVASIVNQEEYDFGASGYVPVTAGSVAELLAMFDRNIAQALEAIQGLTDERLLATWRFKKQGKLMLELPRLGVVRTFLLNHLIHHRGQLSVYLRLQNVPIPSIYGPSADESL